MEGLDLGDRRLNERVRHNLGRMQRHPDASFPEVFDEAELEAHYRLSNNERVHPGAILAPHHDKSWERAVAEPEFRLVLHDTTDITFDGTVARDGLAYDGKKSHLYAHVSLCVGLDDAPVIHGVVGVLFYAVALSRWQPLGLAADVPPLSVGSERWSQAVRSAHETAPPGSPLVHVMDREADDYSLFSMIVEAGDQFVIRACQDRIVEHERTTLNLWLEDAPWVLEREVHLSRRVGHRAPRGMAAHPAREHRSARLAVRTDAVSIVKPVARRRGKLPAALTLNLVEVVELDVPDGETPVHWRLLTTLPVSTPIELALVVDIYRKRWLIEEYFKALKTGCAVEERQAESASALLNTVALLVPVAVRLLQIRSAARTLPNAPSHGMLDAVEILALRALVPRAKLSRMPTNSEVMNAIGLAGGRLRSNGPAGWMVLGRGLERLLEFSAGWRAALSSMQNSGASQAD
jgi:hypothetical protein